MKDMAAVHKDKIGIDSDASLDEILARAKEEGIELSDEQLDQISGGSWDATTMPSEIQQWITCDKCNGREIELTSEDLVRGYVDCPGCGTRYAL